MYCAHDCYCPDVCVIPYSWCLRLELALGTEYGNRTMTVYTNLVLAGVLLLCVVSKTRSTIICVGVHH